jgi:hypothetical protein
LDNLVSKLNRQIQIGVGISEEDALKNLDKSINKLQKWDHITFNDIKKKVGIWVLFTRNLMMMKN